MDPITIIGTAGAVANIVDVIGKTISTLRDLLGRWKEADMAILNLITQLNALKAALSKIAEWISSDLEDIPQHHQLVMDLKDSIHCCKTLIMSMDNQISKLDWKEENTLDVGSRIRVVFETKTSQDFQRFIKRQTSALTLLLVACNCKTLSEQKVVLEKPNSRQIFDQVKEDASSSLFVVYDTASITSCWTASTEISSKLSRIFSFDRELMSTRVFQGSFRSLYKRTLRRGKGTDLDSIKSQSTTKSMVSERKKQEARSRDIDKMLENDGRKMRKEAKVLVMGATDSGKETIMKRIQKNHQNEFTIEDYQAYRDQIRNKTIEDMHTCIKTIMDLESENLQDAEVNKHARMILKHSAPIQEIPQELADAIESLWRVKKDSVCERGPEISAKLVPFFYDEIQRIAKPDYIPTETDIDLLPKATGVQEAKFNLGQLSIRIVDIDSLRGRREKWIYRLEIVTSIIFVVDLASYDQDILDQDILEESPGNKLFESLVLFDSLVNSRYFRRTSIILFLSNVNQFRVKIAKNPLENFFPDYSGGNDVNRASKYILSRFNQVNKAHLNLYPHLVEATDESNLQLIFEAVKETIVRKMSKDANYECPEGNKVSASGDELPYLLPCLLH